MTIDLYHFVGIECVAIWRSHHFNVEGYAKVLKDCAQPKTAQEDTKMTTTRGNFNLIASRTTQRLTNSYNELAYECERALALTHQTRI